MTSNKLIIFLIQTPPSGNSHMPIHNRGFRIHKIPVQILSTNPCAACCRHRNASKGDLSIKSLCRFSSRIPCAACCRHRNAFWGFKHKIPVQILSANPCAACCRYRNASWGFKHKIPVSISQGFLASGPSAQAAASKKINANRPFRRGSRSITKPYAPQHCVVGNNAFLTERVVPEYGRSPDLKLRA